MQNQIIPQESDFLLYTAPEGGVKVGVLMLDETVWLTQKRMAELFGVDLRTINEHLHNIYKSAELSDDRTIRNFRIVQNEGGRQVDREVAFYNLDAIIAVGYRVNSKQATQFRVWATQTLKSYIIKGFVLDEERLKNGVNFGKDYFEQLLEKIREIRASERRFYQKITDLYAQASIDYDATSELTLTFYKTVQNKLHWAMTGKTAAELIVERADHQKPKMGLTTWKQAPSGKILKSDVSIAKNYLQQEELSELNRVVSMYLDYAENQAKKQRLMKMADWVEKLNNFLRFNEYEILNHLGSISHEVAKTLAEKEFDVYRVIQDQEFISDFDRVAQKFLDQSKKSE